jgi:hypothetical protein
MVLSVPPYGLRHKISDSPAGDLVLLTDLGLVGEPNFYRGRLNAIFPRDVCHDRRETFLKRSIAPSAWA